MIKNKKKQEEINADSWENYDFNKNIIKALETYGYYYAFDYFKDNWKKICSNNSFFNSYSFEENEYKNIFLILYCLSTTEPELYNIQCLIGFSNDTKAIEFYEMFAVISKKLKIDFALILDQNKITVDRNILCNEKPEIIIGSIKRIDYTIKKHFLNVFSIKNLILDLSFQSSDDFEKDIYEDILLLMPAEAKKIIFYEENEFFKKKYLKTFENFL